MRLAYHRLRCRQRRNPTAFHAVSHYSMSADADRPAAFASLGRSRAPQGALLSLAPNRALPCRRAMWPRLAIHPPLAYTLRLHLGGMAALRRRRACLATGTQPWSKELKSAQAQDQIRREEAVQPHRDWQ